MKIYAIKRASGYLEHCQFFATKNLALLQLYTLADMHRHEYNFKLIGSDAFSYESELLPDDNGYVRLTSSFTITEIDVKE